MRKTVVKSKKIKHKETHKVNFTTGYALSVAPKHKHNIGDIVYSVKTGTQKLRILDCNTPPTSYSGTFCPFTGEPYDYCRVTESISLSGTINSFLVRTEDLVVESEKEKLLWSLLAQIEDLTKTTAESCLVLNERLLKFKKDVFKCTIISIAIIILIATFGVIGL